MYKHRHSWQQQDRRGGSTDVDEMYRRGGMIMSSTVVAGCFDDDGWPASSYYNNYNNNIFKLRCDNFITMSTWFSFAWTCLSPGRSSTFDLPFSATGSRALNRKTPATHSISLLTWSVSTLQSFTVSKSHSANSRIRIPGAFLCLLNVRLSLSDSFVRANHSSLFKFETNMILIFRVSSG